MYKTAIRRSGHMLWAGLQAYRHPDVACKRWLADANNSKDVSTYRPEVETLLKQGAYVLRLLIHGRFRRDDSAVLLMCRCILNDLQAIFRWLRIPLAG